VELNAEVLVQRFPASSDGFIRQNRLHADALTDDLIRPEDISVTLTAKGRI
jgi:hypothetical protein